MRHILTLSIIVLTLAFPSASYATPVFSFSPIDAGGTATDALGIKASGQIVGAVYHNFYCAEIYGCYPTSSATSISETGFSDQARPREPFCSRSCRINSKSAAVY
jgi:hypothetical protein